MGDDDDEQESTDEEADNNLDKLAALQGKVDIMDFINENKEAKASVVEDDYDNNEIVNISMDVYNLTIAANMTKSCNYQNLHIWIFILNLLSPF